MKFFRGEALEKIRKMGELVLVLRFLVKERDLFKALMENNNLTSELSNFDLKTRLTTSFTLIIEL